MLLALLFLALGQFFHHSGIFETKIGSAVQRLETDISAYENDLSEWLEDSLTLRAIAAKKASAEVMQQVFEEPYLIFIYRNDSLIFWNSNLILPPYPLDNYREGFNVVRLRNGYYDLLKKTLPGDRENDGLVAVGLIPLKYTYPIRNKYLTDDIAFEWAAGEAFDISLEPHNGYLPVRKSDEDIIFYIKEQPTGDPAHLWTQLLFALAAIFLVAWINGFARHWVLHKHPFPGLLFLIASIISLRFLVLDLHFPIDVNQFEVFNPQLYASSSIAGSLGELLLNLLLIFWLALFTYRNVHLRRISKMPVGLVIAVLSVIWLSVFLIGDLQIRIIKSLVIDSRIAFNADDILNLDQYSTLGFAGVAILLISILLIIIKLIAFTNMINRSVYIKLSCFAIALLVYQLIYQFLGLDFPEWAALETGLLILLLNFIRISVKPISSFTTFVFLLIYVAGFAAFWIYQSNTSKEVEQKRLFADKLSIEKDPRLEYYFEPIGRRIHRDNFIRLYFVNPLFSKKEMTDRLQFLYFGGFFKKYDIKMHAFNAEGLPIKEAGISTYQDFVNDHPGEPVPGVDHLYFVRNSKDRFNYYAQFPVRFNRKPVGRMVIRFIPRIFNQENVYPELLVEEKVKPAKEYGKYNYAIYKYGQLVSKMGDFPYRDVIETQGRQMLKGEGDYEHLYFQHSNKVVVVSSEKTSWLGYISLFSIIFCLLSLIFFLILPLGLVLNYLKGNTRLSYSNISFGDRIHFTVVFVLIFSFIMIGTVTFIYFNVQYEDYHRERLLRKGRSIQRAIEYYVVSLEQSTHRMKDIFAYRNELSRKISEIADIHSLDVNLYDQYGNLMVSSQPEIFEKGLISRKMDLKPLAKLTRGNLSRFVQDETIGKLSYLAAYKPIRNSLGQPVAYLNIPYFTREKILKSEITPFLVALINVYVVLLLIAGILALFISRSITNSLTAVSEKFKQVKLGKKNVPIRWKAKDEIGQLVDEYNKMIGELERSAELLAKSEREFAWREMAKQVAHEIKNPLTPMKLSIQHLQRAFHEDHPNVKELADKVSVTLIEQIDTLSNIATEFSSFAKMPKTKNERFNLVEVIDNAIDLYKSNTAVTIRTAYQEQEYFVFSDKNQLLRVFNNLIQNAIQAIPEDRHGQLLVNMERKDDFVWVEVRDNGIGIDPGQKERVFAPNFTTKSSGTGLGLAMSKNIVESTGGTIDFDSSPGEGTSFFVTIPIA